MRVLTFVTAALAMATMPALAADGFVQGVWLKTEEQCALAKKSGIDAVFDAGDLALTAQGIEGLEFNCEFIDIRKASRAPGWLVTAFCQEPGYAFPDVLSVTELNETQLDLVSVKTVLPGEVPGNSGTWLKCDGVAVP